MRSKSSSKAGLTENFWQKKNIIQKYIDILYADINDYVDEQNNICLG